VLETADNQPVNAQLAGINNHRRKDLHSVPHHPGGLM
jgi:hypothetical protein